MEEIVWVKSWCLLVLALHDKSRMCSPSSWVGFGCQAIYGGNSQQGWNGNYGVQGPAKLTHQSIGQWHGSMGFFKNWLYAALFPHLDTTVFLFRTQRWRKGNRSGWLQPTQEELNMWTLRFKSHMPPQWSFQSHVPVHPPNKPTVQPPSNIPCFSLGSYNTLLPNCYPSSKIS